MVEIPLRLKSANGKKVLVVGDFMLDTYIFGKAARISPEAPVPVVVAHEEKVLAGGAGNVALNLASLGMAPIVLGRTGNDSAGDQLRKHLKGSKIEVAALFQDKETITSHKTRILAQGQQVVRLDREEIRALSLSLEKEILEQLSSIMEGVTAIVVSDYGKGFVTPTLFQELVSRANERSIPILVDPKGMDYTKYRGASLLKPNLHEAYSAAALPMEASLDAVAEKILSQTGVKTLMITRSEKGISLFSKKGRADFPARAKEVKDVTGAGDAVLAAMALSSISGLRLEEAAEVANVAASIAIEHVGCVQVTLAELLSRVQDWSSN